MSTPKQLAEKIGIEYHHSHPITKWSGSLETSMSWEAFLVCTHEICEDSRILIGHCETMQTALMKITKPEGAYSMDREKYFANIIEWCQDTAQDAVDAVDAVDVKQEVSP